MQSRLLLKLLLACCILFGTYAVFGLLSIFFRFMEKDRMWPDSPFFLLDRVVLMAFWPALLLLLVSGVLWIRWRKKILKETNHRRLRDLWLAVAGDRPGPFRASVILFWLALFISIPALAMFVIETARLGIDPSFFAGSDMEQMHQALYFSSGMLPIPMACFAVRRVVRVFSSAQSRRT